MVEGDERSPHLSGAWRWWLGGGGREGLASQSSCERRTGEASARVCVERRSRRCATVQLPPPGYVWLVTRHCC